MVGYGFTNPVQGILGDTMKFEDIKAGMKVINTFPNGRLNGEVGTVFNCVSSTTIIVKYKVPTDSCLNEEYNEEGLWDTHPAYLEPFIDPEEDLIVWGALEVGEHFKFNQKDSKECVKITPWAYVVLGYTSIHVFYGSTSYKVKLI